MRGVRFWVFGAALLAGCSANEPAPAPETAVPAAPLQQSVAEARSLENVQTAPLRRELTFPMIARNRALASCPEGEVFVPLQPIDVAAEEVGLGKADAAGEALAPNVTYAGGWHLTSDEPNFGGLSGLDILQTGDLLAVSDAGAFVQIGMAEGRPSGGGAISYMRGGDGKLLDGKRSSDSEGLHVGFGLAAVSFERDHRIAVFNLEDCGAAARGVPVGPGSIVSVTGDPPESGLPEDLPENGGLEALTFEDGNLLTGLEAGGQDGTPLFRPTIFFGRFFPAGDLQTPNGMKLTGLDTAGGRTFALFRRYLPLFGNTIEVRRYGTLADDGETLLRLERPLTVDNFEGISARELEDGTMRLYIISDDNFSERQRTLLLAFDVAPDGTPN